MTRAMVTLFTAKPQRHAAHRYASAPSRRRRPARAALLAVVSKLH